MFWYFQLQIFWDDDPPFLGGNGYEMVIQESIVMLENWALASKTSSSYRWLPGWSSSIYIIIYLYYYIYIHIISIYDLYMIYMIYMIYIWSIYDLYMIYLYVHIYVLCINQAVPESTHLSIAHIFVL